MFEKLAGKGSHHEKNVYHACSFCEELNNGLFIKKGLQGEAKGKIKRKIEGDGARQWKMKSKGKGKGKGDQKRKQQSEKKAEMERGKEIFGLSIVNSQCI